MGKDKSQKFVSESSQQVPLASFLLGKSVKTAIDNDLDTIFKTSASSISLPAVPARVSPPSPASEPSVGSELKSSSEKESRQKTKYVPKEETREQRNARTIFVGNLPVEIVKSKPFSRALNRLIVTSISGCKIESTRFRSIAFQNPTNELPKSDDEDHANKGQATPTSSRRRGKVSSADDPDDPDSRAVRQQSRAAHWRGQDSEHPIADAKVFQSPAEKKRVAFIKGEIHTQASTVHAYVVFAHPAPDRAPNVPRVMDPYEAAKAAVEKCDGLSFMGRTLRVDFASGQISGGLAGASGIPGQFDSRRTVFVGGLDFQIKEEDLRAFFEKLVATERGDVDGSGEDDDDDESMGEGHDAPASSSNYVSHVRIVRDKDTQLGKGIAYVEFKDRETVDEVMTVEASKLKLAKRKLRVERCKTQSARFPKPAPRIRDGERTSKPSVPAVVGAKPKPSDATKAHHVSNPASRTYVPTPITIPKGDPALGDRLRSLSKEDRRLAKANDPTRAARRLAKKKASTAVKAASASKVKGGVLGNLKKAGRPKNPAKTSRVRSERSAMKRNVKK